MKIEYQNLSEINEVAKKILKFAKESCNQVKVWLFSGEMGAGKTTLIKAICQELKVVNTVQSPTFSLVNEYQTADNQIIYHFDFYRLRDETEALDMGYEEYFYSHNYCFVEWSEKIPNLLPNQYLQISIQEIASHRLIDLLYYE